MGLLRQKDYVFKKLLNISKLFALAEHTSSVYTKTHKTIFKVEVFCVVTQW
jgi:hypothetical protein